MRAYFVIPQYLDSDDSGVWSQIAAGLCGRSRCNGNNKFWQVICQHLRWECAYKYTLVAAIQYRQYPLVPLSLSYGFSSIFSYFHTCSAIFSTLFTHGLNLLQPRSSMVDLDEKRVQACGLDWGFRGSWDWFMDSVGSLFFAWHVFWTLSIYKYWYLYLCVCVCAWFCDSCDLAVICLKCCIECLIQLIIRCISPFL